MPTIAFVTYHGAPDLTADDRLAISPLGRHGFEVAAVEWNARDVRWNDYAAVVIRSCWDYHLAPDAFGAWIGEMERDGIPLWNPSALVRWNLAKTYLRDLGVPIPPTAWIARSQDISLGSILREAGWDGAVVKPTISASAASTWTTSLAEAASHESEFRRMLVRGDVMVQRFEPAIVSHGEWSLLFFGGEFSHAVIKRARPGDFRVQHQHGGTAVPAQPPSRVLAAAERALERMADPWLYARVDLVEGKDDVLLMELEMIEPQLFLSDDPAAPGRFAAAIASVIRNPRVLRRAE